MSLLYAIHAVQVDDFHVETPAVEAARPTVAAQNQQAMANLMGAMGNVRGGPRIG